MYVVYLQRGGVTNDPRGIGITSVAVQRAIKLFRLAGRFPRIRWEDEEDEEEGGRRRRRLFIR